jgi:hypothetical protein
MIAADELARGKSSMHRGIAVGGLCALLALAGCLPENGLNDNYLRLYAVPNSSPESFYECHGFGCARHDHIALAPEEWESVRARFRPAAPDAQSERRQVAEAVALLQRLVGERTGTSAHQWTHRDFQIDDNPTGDLTQLDCIDESVNTWTYLTLMAKDGLFKFHRVGPLSAAGGIITFDFRNTAVLIEEPSGTLFAVDATLVDAAEPPPIFPLALWRAQWPPKIPEADRDQRSDTANPARALR